MIFAPVSLALIEEASIVAGQRLVDVADGPGNMIEEEQTNCRELEFGAFCQFIFLLIFPITLAPMLLPVLQCDSQARTAFGVAQRLPE